MEKHIIFTDLMVRAVLAGNKTQTRVLMEPQPPVNVNKIKIYDAKLDLLIEETITKAGDEFSIKAPYQPGDTLWVRETWRIGAWDEVKSAICIDYKADGYVREEWIFIDDRKRFNRYWTQTVDDALKAGLICEDDGRFHWEKGQAPTRWRAPFHMSRDMARILLKVKNVRVERYHDITEDDAKKEGFEGTKEFSRYFDTYLDKKDCTGNPWLWVLDFERVV